MPISSTVSDLMLRVHFPRGLAIRKKELPVTVLDREKNINKEVGIVENEYTPFKACMSSQLIYAHIPQ
jgi:hypothetical protein